MSKIMSAPGNASTSGAPSGASIAPLTPDLSVAELVADVAFLLARAYAAGSINFREDRWTGTSSNSLVAYAYGGAHNCMPSDRGDYAACVRTYVRLPLHRKTPAVRAALRVAREAYLSRYPEDRFPGIRAATRAERAAAHEAWRKKHGKRRRRRAA